jgi:hypothetical protein
MIIIAVALAIPPGLHQLEESLTRALGHAGQLRRPFRHGGASVISLAPASLSASELAERRSHAHRE